MRTPVDLPCEPARLSRASRWRRGVGAAWLAGAVALAAASVAAPAAAAITLQPLLAGSHATTSGVDARFLKVNDAWHDSSVLWDQAAQVYGQGAPIGGFSWGDGLWGLADWHTANGANPPAGMVTGSWRGRVDAIAFGDDFYNSEHGPTWGTVDLVPLFTPGASQDNWTAFFSGYIRIDQAGLYNFSVLHDDGFFFTLGGDGQTLSLSNDFLNPRERVGFNEDLLLDVGLYGFTLGAYDRLQAGVVELAWARGGTDNWTLVPLENLARPVPSPGTLTLIVAGWLVMAAGGTTLRRRTVTRNVLA